MNLIPRLLLAAIACSALPASAQTMYRCGNAFQDHPCASGQAGQAIGTNASPAAARPSGPAPRLSAECAQRGIAAQKIKWMRDAGKTQQDQLAAAGQDQQDLIADVYRRQGTSVQVRAAIEDDCMAEQERTAQASALLAAANRAKGGSGPAAPPGNDSVATAPTSAPPSARNMAEANAAASKKATCQQLNSALEDVRSRQRSGGDVGIMETLRQQASDLANRRRAAGC